MRRRKSDLSRRSRKAQAKRRIIANLSEEKRALVKERNRQRMAQFRAEEAAERRAARLEDARLRARRSRYARSQQNKRNALKMTERRHHETADQRQTQLLLLYEEHEVSNDIHDSNTKKPSKGYRCDSIDCQIPLKMCSKSEMLDVEESNWETGSESISIKSEPIFEEECDQEVCVNPPTDELLKP